MTVIRAAVGWLTFVVIINLFGCATYKPGEVFSENRRLATTAELADTLQQADFVILGEQHDNPEHHAMQLAVLQELHARGWLKQLSLEMMVPSQQAGADFAVKERMTDLDALYTTLSWDKGWDWEMYGPIVAWATSSGIPIKAANLDKGELKTVREQPVRLGLALLGDEGLNIHRNQFRESHCGHIDKTRQETMLKVQIARDARMASSLLSEPSGSVLLAGNWHARKDIGVPRYVLVSRPDAKIIVVGSMEKPVDASRNRAELYDVTWATTGVERPDYCAMFKSGQLKKS